MDGADPPHSVLRFLSCQLISAPAAIWGEQPIIKNFRFHPGFLFEENELNPEYWRKRAPFEIMAECLKVSPCCACVCVCVRVSACARDCVTGLRLSSSLRNVHGLPPPPLFPHPMHSALVSLG